MYREIFTINSYNHAVSPHRHPNSVVNRSGNPGSEPGLGYTKRALLWLCRGICRPASWLAVWGRSGASVVTGLSDLGPHGALLLTVGKKVSEARTICLRFLKSGLLFPGPIFGFPQHPSL